MPLVTDPNFADECVCFDVHNLVGRCDKGPAPVLVNRFRYPTNAVSIGLAKLRNAVELANPKKNRVCIVYSAQENSEVRRAQYPAYKMNRTHPEGDHYIVAGIRTLRYSDGGMAYFNYETDDISMLSHPDIVSSGFEPHNKPTYKVYDGVRDFMEAASCIPSVTLGMPNNDGETDDALATFTHLARPRKCWVVTEDRDIWATMSDRVTLVSKPDKLYSTASMQEKFGISEPAKLPLAKALYGDDSDNVNKPVPFVTDKSVGDVLRRCVREPGERLYTPAFMREIEASLLSAKGRLISVYENLLREQAAVAHLEGVMRLRYVDLSYTRNTRNVERLRDLLAWYEIKAVDKILAFAEM